MTGGLSQVRASQRAAHKRAAHKALSAEMRELSGRVQEAWPDLADVLVWEARDTRSSHAIRAITCARLYLGGQLEEAWQVYLSIIGGRADRQPIRPGPKSAPEAFGHEDNPGALSAKW